jgi:hypothetical protein
MFLYLRYNLQLQSIQTTTYHTYTFLFFITYNILPNLPPIPAYFKGKIPLHRKL